MSGGGQKGGNQDNYNSIIDKIKFKKSIKIKLLEMLKINKYKWSTESSSMETESKAGWEFVEALF